MNAEKNPRNKEIARIKRLAVPVLKDNKVKKAGIFGSYARGEQKKRSDIDILIEFNGSLLDVVGIPTIFLRHIIDSINKIESFMKEISESAFNRNELVKSAVIRQIEIIGEAVKNLPKSFTQ